MSNFESQQRFSLNGPPRQVPLLDHLPGSPRVDASGDITVQNPLGSLLVLILPLVSLVGHGCVVWFWWLA